jgi:peptidoglycan/xylan/chitin deacetylase (PgdA/CDA1 family)
MKKVIVTTSWDDGHLLDLRLAQMLQDAGLKGTFYISPSNREFSERDLLDSQQISDLSNAFEIGAHTLTHPRLPKVSLVDARREITDCKVALEEITGKEVTTFCYPGGSYTAAHVQMVKDAGYQYARTVGRYAFAVNNPYEAPTTLHAYKHWSDLADMARFARFRPLKFARYLQWDELAKAMFDHTAKVGGVYHLWGHSWEIDQYGYWERLAGVFSHIAGRPGVIYATNGDLA